MTALPQPPGRLLTVAAYADLDDGVGYRWELQEGSLVMTPSPTPGHMIASGRLFSQLDRQLPPGMRVVQDVDLDLQLSPADQPGWSRRPDLVVVRREAVTRVARDGGLLRASESLIVVEIVSPGSRRTDQVIKRGEYADAGIPHYWIIDLDPPASLTACHLAGGFGYQDREAATGRFTVSEPLDLEVDLTSLG